MKEYCVDFEIAKELKENGFPQNTIYYWHDIHGYPEFEDFRANDYTDLSCCSAPTSDEILKELPKYINNFGKLLLDFTQYMHRDYMVENNYPLINNELSIQLVQGHFVYYGNRNGDPQTTKTFYDDKLSHALAKTWLHLKKEGHI